MDGKPKATLENSIIKAYFSRQESTSFFPFTRKSNPDLLEELKSIRKPEKGVNI